MSFSFRFKEPGLLGCHPISYTPILQKPLTIWRKFSFPSWLWSSPSKSMIFYKCVRMQQKGLSQRVGWGKLWGLFCEEVGCFCISQIFFNEKKKKKKPWTLCGQSLNITIWPCFHFQFFLCPHQNTKMIPRNWHRETVVEYQILLPSDFTLPNSLLGKTQRLN